MPYDYKPFPYFAPPGLDAPEPRHKVVIVGAGPVGLALALDLAGQGIPSVLLGDGDTVSVGSRAICWSRRSLQIFHRLGIAEKMLDKGVAWSVGRVSHGDAEVCAYDLDDGPAQRMPAFLNLQQYYVEEFLAERALAEPLIDLRFRNRVTSVDHDEDEAHLTVRTPDGRYTLTAEYVLACDGARSTIRSILGLEFQGELYEERFLIADIEMVADFPPERWFWFAPSFHDGQSALLQPQADNIYRLDLQLDPQADAAEVARRENVIPRIEKVVGPDFELEWVSVYKFQCRRLRRLVHGRVIFLGDAAHLVPPFGARGGNGGVQDAANLGWKLAAVLEGRAPPALLESYDRERVQAAEADVRQSAGSARFITPAPGMERLFRDQVLKLARKADFARGWVDSGRLSPEGAAAHGGPDDPLLPRATRPGQPAPDVPQGNGWLLDLPGRDVTLLAVGAEPPEGTGLPCLHLRASEPVRARYLGDASSALYLLRPDHVIAARWVTAEAAQIAAAAAALWEGRL